MDDSIVNGLAVIGAVSCFYWVFRGGAALLRFARGSPGGAEPPPAAARDAPRPAPTAPPPPLVADTDIAVITAAAYAMLGTARILHLEDLRSGTVWTTEGRLLQQTSHSRR
jgi:hypothetical protein